MAAADNKLAPDNKRKFGKRSTEEAREKLTEVEMNRLGAALLIAAAFALGAPTHARAAHPLPACNNIEVYEKLVSSWRPREIYEVRDVLALRKGSAGAMCIGRPALIGKPSSPSNG